MSPPRERPPMEIEAAIARLKAHKLADALLPSPFTEDLAVLLLGSAELGRWSHMARALHDAGAALALFDALFPADRWLLGRDADVPGTPRYQFACFPPYGSSEGTEGGLPAPWCEAAHDILGVAVVLVALQRRRQLPLRLQAANGADGRRRRPPAEDGDP